jgi:hypothetical protein
MKNRFLLLVVLLYGCGDPSAQEVLAEVEVTYRDLETYVSEGTIEGKISLGGMEEEGEVAFRLLLKKPNLYLITWKAKDGEGEGEGAIWNGGSQPYTYYRVEGPDGDRYSYCKARDDSSAIAAANGVSHGASSTIPPLFFPEFYPDWQRGLSSVFVENARIDRVEEVQGEACYVITGPSASCKEETYWISKSRNFIVKYYHSIGPPDGAIPLPKFDEETIAKLLGPEASDEVVARLKERTDEAAEIWESPDLTGSSTETHTRISTPVLGKAEFRYKVPKGAVLKESWWAHLSEREPEAE